MLLLVEWTQGLTSVVRMRESWSHPSWMGVSWWGSGTSNPSTTQANIQGFVLTHLNISLTYDLLKHVKGLDLQNDSHRISLTWGHSRILKSSFGDSPVLRVYQKSEALK